MLGEKFLPGRPIALVVVALSIIVVSVSPLPGFGLELVGTLPSGLPDFELPGLQLRDVKEVVPLAFACFLLAYVESVSAARALAEMSGEDVDPRQELLGLGAANLAAGFFQAYPVAGGLSQSSVNAKAGARTPLALVFASAAIALCLMYLTGLLSHLPEVVLAAIVLVAVKSLVDIAGLRHLWRVSRAEFGVSMIAFAAVLVLGILNGVIVAALVSLLLVIHRVANPHVAFLGRIPGTVAYSDMERNPNNEAIPGVLVFRVEASLLYFNVEHVQEAVWRKVRSMAGQIELVICDLSNSPFFDLAGAQMLSKLYKELQAEGIRLRLVAAHAAVRDVLRAQGLEEIVGRFGRRTSVAEAVDKFLRKQGR